ncbi:MAG: hypothetical protein J6R77_06785 [Clostridia bacterium]|nr:hypothetical protein [Clostridia bacterium]
MRYILGLILLVAGGVLLAVTGLYPLMAVFLAGLVLLLAAPTEGVFVDYILAEEDGALMRRRHYWRFIPFSLVLQLLTFGRVDLLLPWKDEYFKAVPGEEEIQLHPLSRQEYMALRQQQRQFYATATLTREFMEERYTLAAIGFGKKKARLIAAWVVAVLGLTTLTVPGGWLAALAYEAFCIPMICWWTPPYTDAKILHGAFLRATTNPQ